MTLLALVNLLLAGIYWIGPFYLLGDLLRGLRGSTYAVYSPWQAGSLLALTLASLVLLAATAVGYLGRRRFLGRILGNLLVGCLIATPVATLLLVGKLEPAGVLIHLGYAVITFHLVNDTFRRQLAR